MRDGSALVTVIGDAGFWGRSLYLVGGLVPRYLVGAVAPPTPAHVGSRDVDLLPADHRLVEIEAVTAR